MFKKKSHKREKLERNLISNKFCGIREKKATLCHIPLRGDFIAASIKPPSS